MALASIKLGAKAQSIVPGTARGVLTDVIANNPQATIEEIIEITRQELKKNEGFVNSIIDYWCRNTYRSLAYGPGSRPTRDDIDRVKTAISEIAFLDLILPNGKRLADCTGAECMQAGGWLIEVGRRAGRNIVSRVLSEDQLTQIWLNKQSPAR